MAEKKVLVVDDVEIVFSAFKQELENEGFEVDTALSGEAAVEKAKEQEYDVIFIDMVMPGLDGAELCGRRIRLDYTE